MASAGDAMVDLHQNTRSQEIKVPPVEAINRISDPSFDRAQGFRKVETGVGK